MFNFLIIINIIEASRAGAQGVTEKSLSNRRRNIYLNLYFLLYGVEVRHSTRNASRIRWKVRNVVS